jgi:hypothetical protein
MIALDRRLAAMLVLVAAGCGSFHAATPSGFVSLRDQDDYGYDYRATTADGVVLAVRAMDNDVAGDQDFWSKAISDRVRTMGGYALLDTHDVKCRGLAGKQFRFGHDEGRTPHLYVVSLFVTKKRIFVLEAGGEKSLVERDGAKIDEFVAGFDPR